MRRGILLIVAFLACAAAMDDSDPDRDARQRMIEHQLRARDITDPAVLGAMSRVPRERFVAAGDRRDAYGDHPLPIGYGATISQPYVVALMSQLARVRSGDRVLDVGTGSGYQAAVLAEMGAEVYSVEVVPELADSAATLLRELGYRDVHVRAGDGYRGWPEVAPFDAIIIAAAAPALPRPLVDQLKPGGRIIIPLGKYIQELQVIEKRPSGDLHVETLIPVRFVPMVGEVESQR